MRKDAVTALLVSLALASCMTSRPAATPSAFADSGDSAPAAAIIAAMNGGLIGGSVGEGLGAGDRRRALEAEYRALEYTPAGETVAWGESGGRGGYGEVTAGQAYSVGQQNCRTYTQSVTMRGATKSARGSACRSVNGAWTPLS